MLVQLVTSFGFQGRVVFAYSLFTVFNSPPPPPSSPDTFPGCDRRRAGPRGRKPPGQRAHRGRDLGGLQRCLHFDAGAGQDCRHRGVPRAAGAEDDPEGVGRSDPAHWLPGAAWRCGVWHAMSCATFLGYVEKQIPIYLCLNLWSPLSTDVCMYVCAATLMHFLVVENSHPLRLGFSDDTAVVVSCFMTLEYSSSPYFVFFFFFPSRVQFRR